MSTLCPSAYPTILPSIHSTINQIITAHSLSGIQKISVQGLSTLSVCYFRKTDVCRRGPGPHGAVYISDLHLTEVYLESCGWCEGPWCHPSDEWVCFCAAFLPALLRSCVRKDRPSVSTSLSSVTLFISFPLYPLPEGPFSDLSSPHHPLFSRSRNIQPPWKESFLSLTGKRICSSPYSETWVLAT